jgi:hypothetical protein
MWAMFRWATDFNQDLSTWQFNTTVSLTDFVSFSGLDVTNYEALLQAFDDQGLQNKTLGADDLYYCDETARTNLISNKGWTIEGDINTTGSGLLICVEDAFRSFNDVINNTFTVSGNEFDPTAFCFNANYTVTNDYNNLASLDGEVFNEGTHSIIWTATDTNNETSSCSFVLVVDPSLATEDFNLSSIALYPNPTNAILNLSNPQSINLESIYIYDLTGRLIEKKSLIEMGSETSINVSSYSSGSYLAILKSATKGSLSKQLVIIK